MSETATPGRKTWPKRLRMKLVARNGKTAELRRYGRDFMVFWRNEETGGWESLPLLRIKKERR